MKKSIRTIMCFVLSTIFVMSLVPIINASDEFDASVSAEALTDGQTLYCIAAIRNTSTVEALLRWCRRCMTRTTLN